MLPGVPIFLCFQPVAVRTQGLEIIDVIVTMIAVNMVHV